MGRKNYRKSCSIIRRPCRNPHSKTSDLATAVNLMVWLWVTRFTSSRITSSRQRRNVERKKIWPRNQWDPRPRVVLMHTAMVGPGIEMEPRHRVSDLAGSGRVTGQCVRPGVWPGFEFQHARLSWRCFYRVTPYRQTNIRGFGFGLVLVTALLVYLF